MRLDRGGLRVGVQIVGRWYDEGGILDLAEGLAAAPGVEQVARSAAPILAPGGVVVTIQNGLGSADRVAEAIGEDRVIVGVVGGFGASILAPGHARRRSEIGVISGAVPRVAAGVGLAAPVNQAGSALARAIESRFD